MEMKKEMKREEKLSERLNLNELDSQRYSKDTRKVEVVEVELGNGELNLV